MSTEIIDDDEGMPWSPWAIAAAVLLLLVVCIIAVGTLRGCFFVDPQQAALDDDEKKKKEEEEKKDKKKDFVLLTPIVMPSEPKQAIPLVKPGHWETISQEMTSNYRDFVGDSRAWIADAQNRPFPVADTPFHVRASRPVALTKARMKTTDTTLFIPETSQNMRLMPELEERGLGFAMPQGFTPLNPMPSYQYNFVILSKEPSRYTFIKTIDSVKVPWGGESDADDTQDPVFYNVVPLATGQSIALPDNPLTWTSIAYLLWDEVDPGDPFSPDQKKALVDWIHWGGQLIVSGPDSLDLLKGSFLEPYLPATNAGQIKIAASDKALDELNKTWMISTSKTPGEPLQPKAPWSAITLKLNEGAAFLPKTGQLFAERAVGRGRIVVSAIQLSERDFVNWRSGFESFFNACLLRKPNRKFVPGYYGEVTLAWADESLKARRLDARLNTHLRYLSRDLGVDTAYHYQDVTNESATSLPFNRFGQQVQLKEYVPSEHAGGVGAWHDFSATADASRIALREAAGVEVPGADFVVLCLAAYLVALVPINWLIFRTIGRVEWAWVAAPAIALVGTWVIVQRAQLDIGFVRAQTEIGVLELQPEHPRAHLSRYTALYTSLSTTYDLQTANTTTLVAPFPTKQDFQLLVGQSLTPVNFQRYDDVRLVGLPISSNSTGMVHSEQMHALDGPIRIGTSTATKGLQIENRTKLALSSVCVVRKPTANEVKSKRRAFEGRWIGELLPGQSAPTSERMSDVTDPKVPFGKERTDEASRLNSPRLNLEPMFRLALDPQYMEDGETRLVARVDEVLPGQLITPEASQVLGATIVVAHLKYADRDPPVPDINTRRDINATDDSPTEETVF